MVIPNLFYYSVEESTFGASIGVPDVSEPIFEGLEVLVSCLFFFPIFGGPAFFGFFSSISRCVSSSQLLDATITRCLLSCCIFLNGLHVEAVLLACLWNDD